MNDLDINVESAQKFGIISEMKDQTQVFNEIMGDGVIEFGTRDIDTSTSMKTHLGDRND